MNAYSLRFKGVEKTYVDHLRDIHSEERSELLARSRQLSADTSKRRKALALRRKAVAQREEKRRQEILQKRRDQIREATEKYQRGNKHYSPDDYETPDYAHTPTLEEALSVVHGTQLHRHEGSAGGVARLGSASRAGTWSHFRTYSASAATGGVARLGSATSVRSTSSGSSLVNNRNVSTRYNYKTNDSAKQQQLHNTSLRNLTSSRSLFEQQLEHHQQLLVDQQKQSLHQFNEAIKQEIEADPRVQGVVENVDDFRPDSPDSVDSLEVNNVAGARSEVIERSEKTCADNRANVNPRYEVNGRSEVNSRSEFSQNAALNAKSDFHKRSEVNGRSEHIYARSDTVQQLHQSQLHQSQLPQAQLHQARLPQTQLPQAQLPQAQLHQTQLPQAQLPQAQLPQTHQAQLHQAQLPQTQTGPTMYSSRLGISSIANSGFNLHNSRSSQSPVAVVQPQVHHERSNEGHTVENTVKPHIQTDSYQNGAQDNDPQKTFDYVAANGDGRKNGHLSYQNSVVGFVNGNQLDISSKHHYASPYYENAPQHSAMSNTWVNPSLEKPPSSSVNDHVSSNAPSSTRITIPTAVTYAGKTHTFENRTKTNNAVVNCTPSGGVIQTPSAVVKQVVASGVRPLPVTYPPTSVISTPTNANTSSGYAVQDMTFSNYTAPVRPPVTQSFATRTFDHSTNGTGSKNDATLSTICQANGANSTLSAQALDMLKHYSQYPLYKVAEPIDPEDKNSIISETSTLVSGSDVASESRPEPEVRSILKKFSSYGPPLHPTKSGSATNLHQVGGTKMLTRSKSAHTGLRDSVEVARNRYDTPIKRPKSVRWTDMDYVEENIDQEQNNNKLTKKPPLHSTLSKRSPSKIPRVSTAETERQVPLLHPHPPSHPPTGRAATRPNQKSIFKPAEEKDLHEASAPVLDTHIVKPSIANPDLSKTQAIYDPNGLRLDRTPTDDEINFLWDKVRTCLSRQSNNSIAESMQSKSQAQNPTVSQKYIDGNSLAPNHRVATRVNNPYGNNYMGTANVNNHVRKKINMDTLNNFTRRQNLLNQRNKLTPSKPTIGDMHVPVSMTMLSLAGQREAINHVETPVRNYGDGNYGDVSESMAAFLTAETLTHHSVTDSQIEAAMEKARQEQQAINSNLPKQKVPTALSIEEQRLIQSLERLNERLRLTETDMYPTTTTMGSTFTPNPPPPCHAGFKGRQPMASAPVSRRHVNGNGTVPRHQYRASSATTHTTSYGGQYRYR